jgi:PAS domain S-box-containing protein
MSVGNDIDHDPSFGIRAIRAAAAGRGRAVPEAGLLAAIVESSSDAILSRDLDGFITSWNAAATDMLGYTAHEIIGTSILRLIPDELQAEFQRLDARVKAGGTVTNVPTRRRAKNGRVLDMAFSSSPLRDASGAVVGVAAILRDITGQVARQRELDRLSHLYAALSAINQAIVWSRTRDELFAKVCTALVGPGGLRMVWVGWNDAAAALLRPVASAGDDSRYLDEVSVHTDDRPEARGPSGRAFRTGQSCIINDMEDDPGTLPWRDKLRARNFRAVAAFPIRLAGEVQGALSVYADTRGYFQPREVALLEEAAADLSFALEAFDREAARQQAEQRLRSEMLFSETMIESMPGIVYFYDITGRFLRWNRNFETVSGYRHDEIAAMQPHDFLAEPDRPALDRKIREVFETGQSSIEALFRARDGRETPYFFTGRRVAFGGVPCLAGVGIDITERRQAEAERAARARAEAADQIKSAFLATMSHELRTPLNSIIGFTGLMQRGLAGPLNEEQARQLGMVRSSADHLLALVNDVLDISKIKAGQLTIARHRFNLEAAIRAALAVVAPQAEARNLALQVELAADLGEMCSDRRRLEQILLNLLTNAIKFTERGCVCLRARRARNDTLGAMALAGRPAEAEMLALAVADTGNGIATEDLGTLFEPFRQIDSGLSRRHDGTGLGLAISQRLAGLMGGRIAAASHLGQGSTFRLVLPLDGDAA